MNEIKLKLCPFCGGKARLMDMGYPHWVYCENCYAKVHGGTHDEKDSIEAWNRRIEHGKEELPPAQQWIPVTERLPEEEVNVLVTRKYGTKRYVETAELICGEWLCDMDEYKINPKVHSKPIAWMPLPEPYAPTQSNDPKALDALGKGDK